MATARAGQMEQVDIRLDAMAAPRKKPFAWNLLLVHVLLIACVAVVAFPLYFAFVISTQDLQQVVQRPPRLIPSVHAVDNYVEAWRTLHNLLEVLSGDDEGEIERKGDYGHAGDEQHVNEQAVPGERLLARGGHGVPSDAHLLHLPCASRGHLASLLSLTSTGLSTC